MLDDDTFMSDEHHRPLYCRQEMDVPLVHPQHGPNRYRAGSITVTQSPAMSHASSTEEILLVRSSSETRTEMMNFSPYALYKTGGTIHCESIGYSTGGDLIVLKNDALTERDPCPPSPIQLPPSVLDAFSLENGKMYPGVRVVRGRRNRNRTANTYLLPKVVCRNNSPVPDMFEESPTIHSQRFVPVSNEKRNSETPLQHKKKSACKKNPLLVKDHSDFMKAVATNDAMLKVFKDLESKIVAWITTEDFQQDLCIVLEDAPSRKMVHCLASYYGLRSSSEENEEGQRLVRVTVLKTLVPVLPAQTLATYTTHHLLIK
jgi:hypothetical protein